MAAFTELGGRFERNTHNIYQNSKDAEYDTEAVRFLQLNRMIRQTFSHKSVRFLYTGDMELEHLVFNTLDRSDLINDIHFMHIGRMSEPEAGLFLDSLPIPNGYGLTEHLKEEILRRTGPVSPFVLQKLFHALAYIHTPNSKALDSLERAFEALLKSDLFLHEKMCLEQYFPEKQSHFLIQLINLMTQKGNLPAVHVKQLARAQGVKPLGFMHTAKRWDLLQWDEATGCSASPLFLKWWERYETPNTSDNKMAG